ncbi:hypothetical protein MPTA5024_32425 [Microbispora sp. ATCC PTA-5024]|nr:hypothetical protein MPTA5024_32425 [Microbispora sp. ATCC PTA-5024]
MSGKAALWFAAPENAIAALVSSPPMLWARMFTG